MDTKKFIQVKLTDCDTIDFDIIENDSAKRYGISNVRLNGDEYIIDIWKDRLPISPDTDYAAWYAELGDSGTACWSNGDDITTVVQEHFDFWALPLTTSIPETIPEMTILELTKVLLEGFKEDRLFVKIID